MAIQDYETLEHCSITLNQTGLAWQAPLIAANFGAGYRAAVVTAPYGLKSWTLEASILPDTSDYEITYPLDGDTATATRMRYFFEFFQRHLLFGDKPFIIRDADTNKKFLVSFAEANVSLDRLAYRMFAGGVSVVERRSPDLLFSADGSIFDAQTPYVTQFIADPLSPSAIRLYMGAGDASGVTGYDLEFATSAAADVNAAPGTGGWTNLLADAAPVASYDHTGLNGSTRYYYRFRGRDEDDNVSGWVTDDAQTFAVPDATDPVVSYFDAQGLYSISEIRIFFTASDNQTSAANLKYDLQWSLNGADGWTNILTKQTATSPVLHQNRQPNTQYFYRLRAWDEAGNISDWAQDSATTLGDETAPQITSFTASGGAQRITLSAAFNDNVGVTGVDLQWATDALGSGGWNFLLNNQPPTSATTLSYVDQPLGDNVTRYYRLRVRDAAGNVTAFTTAQATTDSTPGSNNYMTSSEGNQFTTHLGNKLTLGK